ncbi:MAG TPA: DUF58 domain-containing protein [Spirochaetota bacterium]
MTLILLFLLLVLFFHMQKRYYRAHSFDGTICSVRFSTDGIFEGETGVIRECFENRKFLPLLWLRIEYTLSWAIRLENRKAAARGTFYTLDGLFTLFSYERRTKEYPFVAMKRGVYHVTDLSAMTGDLLNYERIIRQYEKGETLHVYPRLLTHEEIPVECTRMIGEIVSRRNLYEDLFVIRGIREYSPLDSFRRINWYASARTGELKVNEYDLTSTTRIFIYLDCDMRYARDEAVLREDCISLSATLGVEFLMKQISVGFASNGTDAFTGRGAVLSEGDGAVHRTELFRVHSRIDSSSADYPADPFADITFPVERQIYYIFISQDRSGAVYQKYHEVKRRGALASLIFPCDFEATKTVENLTDAIVWERAR